MRRADGQNLQLTPLLFRLLRLINGTRDESELAALLGEEIRRHVTAEDIRLLTEAKLRPAGLLEAPDGSQPDVKKTNPLLALRLKFVVSNPTRTRQLTAPFAFLFVPPIVAAVIGAFLVTMWWVAFEKGLGSALRQAVYEPSLLLLVLGLTLASAAFHEVGHAAACRYGGARPGAMGAGLYLVWPAFYTDVSDSYRLSRGGRLRVDLGGLYFNMVFALAIFGLWWAVRWDALLLVLAAQPLLMARQLVPFVRFDGYHVLADLVGVPDLFHHIKPTLLGLLPTRWGRSENKLLKPWVRAVISLWVFVTIPLLAAILGLMIVALPRIVASAWHSMGIRWTALEASWSSADPAAVVVGLFSLLMAFLPVAGITYLLSRTTHRTARGVWRATSGRPPLRVSAVLAGALVVTGVAWAWWPSDQYRPIDSNEQWTVLDLPQLTAGKTPPGRFFLSFVPPRQRTHARRKARGRPRFLRRFPRRLRSGAPSNRTPSPRLTRWKSPRRSWCVGPDH